MATSTILKAPASLLSRATVLAVWLLFAGVLYLMLPDLPTLGNIGFTIIFVLFSILHCAVCEGWARTGLFFAASAVISYLFEEAGVRTGRIYGAYHYSDLLGPKLGHVPILIPLAWFMMIYPSWMVARALMQGVNTRSPASWPAQAAVAALVMTAWDTVMDPGMARSGNWVWEHGGGYFGVPLRNYFGWLLTTFVVYLIAGWLWRPETLGRPRVSRLFLSLPVIVYAFYAASYLLPGNRSELRVVALFAMGMPGLLALIHTWMPRDQRAI